MQTRRKVKARKTKGKWLGIGGSSNQVAVVQPSSSPSTRVLKRPKSRKARFSAIIGGPIPSPSYNTTNVVVPSSKPKRMPKSAGAIAGQKRLREIRKDEIAERKRQATILKFQRKAEVEEAKGRFLQATAKKREARRKASSLHPIGIVSRIGGRVIGSGMKSMRKSKRKIGW